MFLLFQVIRPRGSQGDRAMRELLPHAKCVLVQNDATTDLWGYVVPVRTPEEVLFAYHTVGGLQIGKFPIADINPFLAQAFNGDIPSNINDFFFKLLTGRISQYQQRVWFMPVEGAIRILCNELMDQLMLKDNALCRSEGIITDQARKLVRKENEIHSLNERLSTAGNDILRLQEDIKAKEWANNSLRTSMEDMTKRLYARDERISRLNGALGTVREMAGAAMVSVIDPKHPDNMANRPSAETPKPPPLPSFPPPVGSATPPSHQPANHHPLHDKHIHKPAERRELQTVGAPVGAAQTSSPGTSSASGADRDADQFQRHYDHDDDGDFDGIDG